MSSVSSHAAGEVHVHLGVRNERIASVRLTSSRPLDFPQRLFAGRRVETVLDLLPMVFNVCGTAQSNTLVQAVECAAGTAVNSQHLRARKLLVLAEIAREHLFRVLVGWTDWLGIAPPADDLGAFAQQRRDWGRALYPEGDAFKPGGGALRPDATRLSRLLESLENLTHRAMGERADDWLAGRIQAEGFDEWAASSGTGGAVAGRMIHAVISGGLAGLGASKVEPLPSIDNAQLNSLLHGESADDFVARPEWDGAPHETGALERNAEVPMVAASLARYGNALLPRLLARLYELAATLQQIRHEVSTIRSAAAGEAPRAISGVGIAQTQAARGLLVHRVCLVDGVVGDYRILAPTEWNFHPNGVLAQGLKSLPTRELPRLAGLLVDAIDPCVESRIEVVADA